MGFPKRARRGAQAARDGGRLAAASKRFVSVWDRRQLDAPLFWGLIPPGENGDFVSLSPSGNTVILSRNSEHLCWNLPR
ncbi:MAG: hypothetical protein JKY65_14415 [Planctomycetes bacterium]|nr:hypothetical protein [Planctomycetota bacterium]